MHDVILHTVHLKNCCTFIFYHIFQFAVYPMERINFLQIFFIWYRLRRIIIKKNILKKLFLLIDHIHSFQFDKFDKITLNQKSINFQFFFKWSVTGNCIEIYHWLQSGLKKHDANSSGISETLYSRSYTESFFNIL